MSVSTQKSLKFSPLIRLNAKRDYGDGKYIAMRWKGIPTGVRRSLILFVFTIPFEAGATTFMSGSLSLTKIIGFCFAVIFFFYYNPSRKLRPLPSIPPSMWWFLGYLMVFALNGLLLPNEDLRPLFSRFITLLQLIVLFWMILTLVEDDNTRQTVLVTYMIASAMLASGTLFAVPGFSGSFGEGRATAMEANNPNATGALMAIAAVGLIGLFRGGVFSRSKNLIFLFMLIPLIVLLVKTGSRGAIAAFVMGCSVYLFLWWRPKRKVWTVLLGFFGVVALLYIAATDPLTSERWQQTYQEGDVAGRDTIYLAAFEMIMERPLFGWKPLEMWRELGSRVGEFERDAHNLVLHLLLEVGLVGSIPFFVGLYLCLRAAWRASNGKSGPLYLALLITTLATNMANTGLAQKPFWLVLALASASQSVRSKRLGNRSGILLIRTSERA